MSGHDEHEPVWGLPSAPPPGEEILWQGRPDWKRFAVSALKIRWVALYLGVVVVAKIAFGLNRGEALEGLGQMLALFGLCLGFVAWPPGLLGPIEEKQICSGLFFCIVF